MEKPQSHIIAYQWHQEEEQTNQDRHCPSRKPKKGKVTSSLFPKTGDRNARQDRNKTKGQQTGQNS